MLAARAFAPASMIPKNGYRFSEKDHAPLTSEGATAE
jgi:hypothetical protein